MAPQTPRWRTLVADPTAFRTEQELLGRFWTFLGFLDDIPLPGDWFRATLGGRSIFVQHFAAGIRAFANACAHRQYPLRTSERGNGQIRCGFHHWQYDPDGLAVGIPKCMEQFGIPPRQLGKRLEAVDIETCGRLIFGRFREAGSERQESLEDYLAEGFPILQTSFDETSPIVRSSTSTTANWKFGYQISLDDYHIVAVHPRTFGKQGYLAPASVEYFRFGRHSAYFHDSGPDSLKAMALDCGANAYAPTDYKIFQFFPNLVLVHFGAAGRWYVLLQQYVPLACDRTLLRCWLAPAPFGSPQYAVLRRPVEPLITRIVMHYVRQIAEEDNAICEQLHRTAHEARCDPVFGLHERRVAWFGQAYDEIVNGHATHAPSGSISARPRDPEPRAAGR